MLPQEDFDGARLQGLANKTKDRHRTRCRPALAAIYESARWIGATGQNGRHALVGLLRLKSHPNPPPFRAQS